MRLGLRSRSGVVGTGNVDASAVHDDGVGEIAALGDKGLLEVDDVILIEDSGDSYEKKKILGAALGGEWFTVISGTRQDYASGGIVDFDTSLGASSEHGLTVGASGIIALPDLTDLGLQWELEASLAMDADASGTFTYGWNTDPGGTPVPIGKLGLVASFNANLNSSAGGLAASALAYSLGGVNVGVLYGSGGPASDLEIIHAVARIRQVRA